MVGLGTLYILYFLIAFSFVGKDHLLLIIAECMFDHFNKK